MSFLNYLIKNYFSWIIVACLFIFKTVTLKLECASELSGRFVKTDLGASPDISNLVVSLGGGGRSENLHF